MIREAIMGALFAKLTSPPLVFNFTADTTTGSNTLAAVSDTSGLMVGMPVMGDGLARDSAIASVTPLVTLSLPAIADRSASAMTQGFQTTRRRFADPNAEQDMPAIYLVETNEIHGFRGSNQPVMVEMHCEAWIFTKVGADQNAVSTSVLNYLIDGVERALYPTPTGFQQTLGLAGTVLYCRIEGEVQKDPGANGQLAGAIIPLKLAISQT
jgi:hypothetical protein